MSKLTYYVACTVDGFIAREDGSLADFDMGGEHFADLLREFPETIPGHLRESLGVTGENRRFDSVLMGRRTYQVGLDIGVTNPYPHLDQFLFTQTYATSPDGNVTLVADNPIAFARDLKSQGGKDIWLCGGGALAWSLLPEVDELILKVNPFLMGAGISLIAGGVPKSRLRLQSKRVYENGFMLLHYEMMR